MLRAVPFVALLAATLLQSTTFDGRWSRVETLYRQRVQQTGIVGSGMMFVKDNTVAAKAFEGYQDLTTKRPVDEETQEEAHAVRRA